MLPTRAFSVEAAGKLWNDLSTCRFSAPRLIVINFVQLAHFPDGTPFRSPSGMAIGTYAFVSFRSIETLRSRHTCVSEQVHSRTGSGNGCTDRDKVRIRLRCSEAWYAKACGRFMVPSFRRIPSRCPGQSILFVSSDRKTRGGKAVLLRQC